MERFDVSEGARLAEMVEAAEQGREVEITRGGAVVATIAAAQADAAPAPGLSGRDLLEQVKKLHQELPPEVFNIDWSNAVREMRDKERF